MEKLNIFNPIFALIRKCDPCGTDENRNVVK